MILVKGNSTGRKGKVVGYNSKHSTSQSIQKRDRVKIQDIPEKGTFPNESDYTPINANSNFERICVQMENFITTSKA